LSSHRAAASWLALVKRWDSPLTSAFGSQPILARRHPEYAWVVEFRKWDRVDADRPLSAAEGGQVNVGVVREHAEALGERLRAPRPRRGRRSRRAAGCLAACCAHSRRASPHVRPAAPSQQSGLPRSLRPQRLARRLELVAALARPGRERIRADVGGADTRTASVVTHAIQFPAPPSGRRNQNPRVGGASPSSGIEKAPANDRFCCRHNPARDGARAD
jgi:hypothetical protein